tara:strand:- start:1207 stop:2364 length:1158 start_codon:yes stop_codon:yes gene_type:complete
MLAPIFSKTERIINSRFGLLCLLSICVTSVFFFSFPLYEYRIPDILDENSLDSIGENVLSISSMRSKQIETPFSPLDIQQKGLHQNKLAFRFSMPLIAHVFGLKLIHLIFLQNIMGVLLFLVSFKLCFSIIKDKIASSLFTLGLTFIYVGKTSFVDLVPYFDGAALFFLGLSMLFRSKSMIMLFTLAACFTDERALIATSIVFVYWVFIENKRHISLSSFFTGEFSKMVLIGWLVYFAIRGYLQFELGLMTESEGLGLVYLKSNWPRLLFGWFAALEFYWFIPLMASVLLYSLRKWLKLTLFLIPPLVLLLISWMVADITRSIVMVYPILYVSLVVLNERANPKDWRYVMLALCIFCFFIPSYWVIGPEYGTYEPAFPKILKFVF